MKAVFVNRYGGPEVLSYQDAPDPTPGSDEVLIRTEIANVNFADIKARRGTDSVTTSLPFILGHEVVGTIEAVGAHVHSLRVGQRVTAVITRGAYAELVAAPAALTFPLPETLASEDAAGLVVLMTAFNVLTLAGRITPGESVLVHAAAGGVGSTAIQFAKRLGAGLVIGTVGSDEKAKLVGDLGADHVINYRREPLAARVLELTGGTGVDLILDSVGGSTFDAGLRCLAPGGRVVIFGHTSGEPGHAPTTVLQEENRAVIGYRGRAYLTRRPEVMVQTAKAVLKRVTDGDIRLVIGARFPLREAAAAHRLVEQRESVGKVLLLP